MEFQEIIELCQLVAKIKKSNGCFNGILPSGNTLDANFHLNNNFVHVLIYPEGRNSDEWEYLFDLDKPLKAQQKENLKSCKEKLNRILK